MWLYVMRFAAGMLALFLAPILAPQAAAAWPPLDLIVVVDTSGSMDLEVVEVRAGLNGFATLLRAKGYDLHLILIAEPGPGGLCVPAPLGSGNCPADENLPGYRHVAAMVGSNDALTQVLGQHSQYAASLRPGSRRVILVVSDDDSAISAGEFTTQLIATDSGFGQFQFSSIAASVDPLPYPPGNVCSPPPFYFPLASAEGAVYKQLVAQTSGAFYDLCRQDFDQAWPQIANAIVIFLDGFEDP